MRVASVCVCELGCAVSFSFSRSIDREFCPIDYIIRNACKITHIRESRKWKAILIFTLPKTGESHGHLGTSHPQLSQTMHRLSLKKKHKSALQFLFPHFFVLLSCHLHIAIGFFSFCTSFIIYK